MVARNQVEYLLLRWARNEPPQLPVKRILYIAGWIEPNGWVIGSAHYLSFVINVCCCNKRLGPSVVPGTNGFELLYNGRQNTQSHRMHNKAVNAQINSIALVNQGSFTSRRLMARLREDCICRELYMCCNHPPNVQVQRNWPYLKYYKIIRILYLLSAPYWLLHLELLRNSHKTHLNPEILCQKWDFWLRKIILLNIFLSRTYICFLF